MTKKRAVRHSNAGNEKQRTRKSRAGQDSHKSGLNVRKPKPSTEPDVEHASPHKAKPVSLPELTCLKPKLIAGEWI